MDRDTSPQICGIAGLKILAVAATLSAIPAVSEFFCFTNRNVYNAERPSTAEHIGEAESRSTRRCSIRLRKVKGKGKR